MNKLEVWDSSSAGSTSTQQEMPDFSFSPQEYITQIGQYLMTLPQHLEPYMTNENPALSRAFQVSQSLNFDLPLRCPLSALVYTAGAGVPLLLGLAGDGGAEPG